MKALQPNLDLAPHPLECGGLTCLRHVEKLTPLYEGKARLARRVGGLKACPYNTVSRSAVGAALQRARCGLAALAKALFLAAIRLYQAFLSPVTFSACKFHPSCSRYAYEAIERHGARRGVRLALERLWRCRPFAPGGYDPVPETLEEVQ